MLFICFRFLIKNVLKPPFSFHKVGFVYLEAVFLGAYKFVILIFWEWFLLLCNALFIPENIPCSEICFVWNEYSCFSFLLISVDISFSIFSLLICVFTHLKWVSCRQYIVGFHFFFYLLRESFNWCILFYFYFILEYSWLTMC